MEELQSPSIYSDLSSMYNPAERRLQCGWRFLPLHDAPIASTLSVANHMFNVNTTPSSPSIFVYTEESEVDVS
jgi:hypothetical protein